MQIHTPYTNFGSVGPDFLFFNTKDMDPTIAKFVSTYLEVSTFIEKFKATVIDLVPDQLIAITEAIEAVGDSSVAYTELQSTLNGFRTTLDGLRGLLQEAVVKHITGAVDIFGILKHPIEDGQPARQWWWFDTLHYRRSGKFTQFLLKNSTPGTHLHSYALGYLTHFAADTVGHPFVNTITGGPYRTHSQRHKFVENFQDVWAYNNAFNSDLVYSELYKKFDFGIPGNELPADLRQFIHRAIKSVYGSDFGSSIEEQDVDNAYQLWFKWFRSSTSSGTIPAPRPYSITAEFQQAWEQFQSNASGAFDFIGSGGGGGGIMGFFAALAALILGPILLALALIDFIIGSILTIGMAPIRIMLSIVYEYIYTAFKNYRLGVALNGFAFPLVEHLSQPAALHTTDSGVADNRGVKASDIYARYPLLKYTGMGRESHLVYPRSLSEINNSTPSPLTYLNETPSKYYRGNVTYAAGIISKIKSLTEPDLYGFHKQMRKEHLGNACKLTAELYAYSHRGVIPDLNLDADRGIGYKCWRQGIDDLSPSPISTPVNVNFI